MQSYLELNHPQSPVSTITPTSFDKVTNVEKLVGSCSIPSTWESKTSTVPKDRKVVTISCKKFSIASSTPTRRPRCRKRVSFETDTFGNVLTTEYHSSATANPYHIWWSKEEIMAIHASVFDVCDFFVRFRQDYVAAVVQLLSDCTRSTASRFRLRRQGSLVDVTNSSCRGLESTVVGMVQHRQARTVAQLLQHQQRLRESGTTVCAEESAHLLALQYRRSTVYAALWAQVLADGDAMALDQDDDDDYCLRR